MVLPARLTQVSGARIESAPSGAASVGERVGAAQVVGKGQLLTAKSGTTPHRHL